jgi:hypothetical protein
VDRAGGRPGALFPGAARFPDVALFPEVDRFLDVALFPEVDRFPETVFFDAIGSSLSLLSALSSSRG